MSPNGTKTPTGWAVFAAIVLLILGALNVLFGLAAVLNDRIVSLSDHGVTVWNFETWGWIHIVVGALMVISSFGLFATREWARVLAIVFATLDAIAQIGFITAFPLWSILVVILDVLVIYHLVSRPWQSAQPAS